MNIAEVEAMRIEYYQMILTILVFFCQSSLIVNRNAMNE